MGLTIEVVPYGYLLPRYSGKRPVREGVTPRCSRTQSDRCQTAEQVAVYKLH